MVFKEGFEVGGSLVVEQIIESFVGVHALEDFEGRGGAVG